MKKQTLIMMLVVGLTLAGIVTAHSDTVVKPHEFTPNTPAKAEDVNANFDTVYNQVNKMGQEISIDDTNHRVGIGTANAAYTLSVNGTIQAKEIIVETGWADYVFADTYKLKSLAEVEKDIQTLGHLPNMPSAATIEEKGANLGDMQVKLLEKVEELTLYTIEQQKMITELREKVARLEASRQ